MIWANITDVIDDAEVNDRQAGGRDHLFGVYSFARKVGAGTGSGALSGYALEMIGYQSADKVQSPQVFKTDCILISTLVPALLFFLRDHHAAGGISS